MHEQRGAIGMEVVSHAPSSTDEHGGRGIGRDMDENALLRLVIWCSARARLGNPGNLKSPGFIVSGLPKIDFMSRLPKCQLPSAPKLEPLKNPVRAFSTISGL